MPVSDSVRRDLAPHGVLRAALNHGNRVLVNRDANGDAFGITVDIARALADEIGLELTLIDHERAIDVSSTAGDDLWDICFLAVDPKRAETIAFTHPYIRIEGCFLVAQGVGITDPDALVAADVAISSVEGSAYTLHLARQPVSDKLVIFPDFQSALAAMDAGQVAAIAGVRQPLLHEAEKRPGSRVLDPPFMEILQAMGTPASRSEAAVFLKTFITDLTRSGRVGQILERHGVSAECADIF
ncbi:transporter substrate-binding domain-containing protein [Martelella soudanensis]|uniref:transporter substrate-binding domain-containing protein n=1 Tax=unclassified Martelella TaxID=2629616 RepID=UPI0015DE9791|nr:MULTISPECIES: transporter substrate-binding domain-containing protein [unclassified Martelella]